MTSTSTSKTQALIFASISLLIILAWSGMHPYDRVTWVMEVAPVVIALPILCLSYRTYPLTSLLYVLIFLHALVLIFGGIYTYARVPIGFEVQAMFDLSRNPYDKLGHFMQGFVPALIAREIFIRGEFVRKGNGKMMAFLVLCVVLAISALYELIEWAAALMMGQGAEEFLGTQGDVWDTQSDMWTALIGGTTSLLLLSRLHNIQLRNLNSMTN